MPNIVLGDLIRELVTASERMSAKNPNKVLVLQAAEILIQMGTRVGELEAREPRQFAAESATVGLVLTDG